MRYRDYLVNSSGVSADQVVAVGFGQTRPLAPNDTTEGRAQNRRVEFIFFFEVKLNSKGDSYERLA